MTGIAGSLSGINSSSLSFREAVFYFLNPLRPRLTRIRFAAAPVERILFRHPDVVMAAVYAVPDAHGGDQVMAALELSEGARFDPDAFVDFLAAQPDLGTKWAPRFVRVTGQMPLTGTNKVLKGPLQHEGWDTADDVWWRPARGETTYRPLVDDDRKLLAEELETHGRSYHRTP